MDRQLVLHSPFNFKTHNETFVCYCEVVVWPNGKIEYAVPSYQEKLIQEYMKKHNLTREECEKEWIKDFDWIDKAIQDLKLVFVWYDHYTANFKLTEEQINSLKNLQRQHCCEFNINFI